MPSKNSKNEQLLTRREFIHKIALTCGLSAGAAGWGILFYSDKPVRKKKSKIYYLRDFRIETSQLHPELVVVRGKNPAKMAMAAIEKLGGMSRFIQPGEKVLIKPNAGWDRQPEQAANTNPVLVGAIVRLCKEAKASSIWVTDVSINDPYRCFKRSGIETAVRTAGGSIKIGGKNDFLQTDLKGEVLGVWPVSRFYHQVDKIINIPVVKHHSLSKCTLAMKNWYGILGGRRNQLHQNIDLSIVDLAHAVKPTITIMDATRVLKRNGPTGGNLEDVSIENTIIAGLDEVAIDSYSLRFLDLKVEEVKFIELAQKRGIGKSDWRSLNPVEINIT